MSETPFWRRQLPAIIIGLGNIFAIGLGGGLPVFSVLLGFPVGWWHGRRHGAEGVTREALRSVLLAAGALAGASFIVLLIVWGPHLPRAFDPAVDAGAWGIPLILYTSQASKIGWFALMMLGGPLLQFMAFVTTAAVALVLRKTVAGSDAESA